MPSSAAPIAIDDGRRAGREHRDERHALAAILGDDLLEDRRLIDRPAQVERDEQQREGDEERDAPAPCGELFGGQHDRHDDEQHGGEDRADRRAELGDRRVERALDGAGVLGGEQDRAAPFAAEREALGDAQQHQQHRADPAGLRVGGQQADEAGRDAHHADGPEQRRAPAEPVAHVPEDHGADRAHDERHGDRREREQLRAERAERLEEEGPDEVGREVGEDVEVEGLERGSDHRRPGDAADGGGGGSQRCRRGHGHPSCHSLDG